MIVSPLAGLTPCRSSLIKLLATSALCLAAATSALAQAGPPMLTDDPGTAPKGKIEWNTAAAIQRNRDGSGETLLPIVDISYGLTENVELSYESHWMIAREPDAAAKAGWDDTTLAFKWRFFDEDKAGVDMSIEPQFTFNTGSSAYRRGVLSKNSDLLIPFELGKTLGPVVLNIEAGRDFHAHRAAQTDYWFAGVTLGHEFNPKFEGVVELYLPETSRDFRRNSVILNLGGRYKLGKDSSLLASAGPGIGGAERPKYVAYFGLQLVF
ncbi:MAG: transporter [Opitutales bacterium]